MRTAIKVKQIILTIGLLALCQWSCGADLQLNGRGIANKFQLDYFLAELYVDQISSNAELLASKTSVRMELTVAVEEWSKRQFTEHWNQAIFINNSLEDREIFSDDIVRWLSSIKGSFKKGDHLVFKKSADRFTFTVNGVELFENTDPGLASLFLNTWIGSRPPSSEFRTSILGVNRLHEDRYLQTAMLKPDLTRIKEIRGWLREISPPEPEPIQKLHPESPAPKPDVVNQAREIASSTTDGTEDAIDSSISDSYLAWFAGVPLQEYGDNAVNDVEGSSQREAEDSSQKEVKDFSQKEVKDSALTNADGSSPGSAEGSSQKNVEDSSQKEVEESYLKDADGSLSDTAEGSLSDTAEGSLSDTAEGSLSDIDEEGEDNSLLKVYRSNILTLTYQNLIYPNSAIDRGQEGRVLVKLTLDRKGKVRNMEYDQKSRYSTLNKAVAKAVEQASPYPEPPRKLRGKQIVVSVPIIFSLSG